MRFLEFKCETSVRHLHPAAPHINNSSKSLPEEVTNIEGKPGFRSGTSSNRLKFVASLAFQWEFCGEQST